MSFNERTQKTLHQNTTSVLEIPDSETHSLGMAMELLPHHIVALSANSQQCPISELYLYSWLRDRGVAIKSLLKSAMPGTFGRSNGETEHRGLHFSKSHGRKDLKKPLEVLLGLTCGAHCPPTASA